MQKERLILPCNRIHPLFCLCPSYFILMWKDVCRRNELFGVLSTAPSSFSYHPSSLWVQSISTISMTNSDVLRK